MKKNKVRILIVGGTGFIGYHLAKKCLNLGWSVIIFAIHKPKRIRKLNRVKYLVGNLYNKETLKKIDLNFDYVVNLGGYVDHINKKETFNTHYIGCRNLVRIFKKKNIKLFIQIGSSTEYGNLKSPHGENFKCNPKSIYGRPKYLATKFLLGAYIKNKFPCTILRLYQVFGPRQDNNRLIPIVINSFLKGLTLPCSDGKQYKDFLHVDEVVKAIILTIKSKKVLGEVINIGSGKIINVRWLINFLKKEIKKGKPEFGKLKTRKDENIKVYPNILKAKKILNWKPKKNLIKELKKQIKFHKSNSF